MEQATHGAETAAIDGRVHSVYGTRIRTDSVMHPQSFKRGRNASASVTATVQMHRFQ